MSENTDKPTNGKPKLKKLGSLWKRQSQAGATYFTGQFEEFNGDKVDVVGFVRKTNEKIGKDGQKNPNMPDIEIFLSDKQSSKNGAATDKSKAESVVPKPAAKQVAKAAQKTEPSPVDDDVAF